MKNGKEHQTPIDISQYEDIIHFPHPDSNKHPRMPSRERAAQFLPFAALNGYEDAVEETARVTEEYVELDESRKAVLNEKLQWLLSHLEEEPEAEITWFCPDEKKSGGSYVRIVGRVRKIDVYQRLLILADGSSIPMEQIREIMP